MRATLLEDEIIISDNLICRSCGEAKSLENFDTRNDRKSLRINCKSCRASIQRDRYTKFRINSFFKHKIGRIKARSRSKNLPFNLTEEYIASIWTGACPALGIELTKEDREDESNAELDRIIPSLGYVEGNVVWVSRRANRIKNNASLRELERIVQWLLTL